MNKIYAVYCYGGEYDTYFEIVEKCFKDIKKAEAYKAEREEDNEQTIWLSRKCRNCDGLNKNCPFYLDPSFADEGCANYCGQYESVCYKIVELELEE